jgi:hypothetical protein
MLSAASGWRQGWLSADGILLFRPDRAFSKAQLFQDLWVLWQTRFKRKGFFVDFGATDGVKLSNTWLLEKEFGWEGISPNPFHWHSQLAPTGRRSSIIAVWKVSNQHLSFLALDEDEVAALNCRVRRFPAAAARKNATKIGSRHGFAD